MWMMTSRHPLDLMEVQHNELRKLPGVDLDNPYAPNDAIDIMRQELGNE